MRLPNLLFLLLTLFLAPLFCSQALATGSAQQAEDEAAIKALFSSYMNKYNGYIQGKSLEHVEQLYMPQVMLMSSANPPVAMSADEFGKQVVVFLDGLKSKGVTSVNWQELNIRLLDNNIAIATISPPVIAPMAKSITGSAPLTFYINRNRSGVLLVLRYTSILECKLFNVTRDYGRLGCISPDIGNSPGENTAQRGKNNGREPQHGGKAISTAQSQPRPYPGGVHPLRVRTHRGGPYLIAHSAAS
nr:hypothetical protein [Pseudoalteromonas sp. T1lg75]